MRKYFAVLLVAALSVLIFAASDKVLVMAIETEPVGFDPTLVTAFASHRVLENVYDGLLKYDENMNLVPNLAKDFEVVDPYTIVFEIREGVKFHNGETLTVEDVLFTFERIRDPEVKAPAASYYGEVESIRSFEGNRVEFKLKIPMASSLLPNFAGVNSSILSKSFVQSGANLQLVTNGTGPFYVEEFVAGNYISLKKNSDYFVEGLPHLDGIKMMIMPEEVTRVSALRNGDVDLAKIGEPLSLNQLSTDRFKIFRTPVLSYYLLGFNTTRGALSKPEVRNALNYAINRQMIVKAVAFDEATVTGPLNPELDFWAIQPDQFDEYTYNPEKARRLLTDAGYPNGFEFEIVAAQRYNFDKVAQVIQAQLAEVGVTAKINIVEWGIFISKWRESDFDSFISMNSGSIDPDIQFNRTFRTGGSTNVFLYSNTEVDELLDSGRSESDLNSRRLIYEELQKKLVEDSPMIFLYSANTIFASNDSVEGFRSLANESLIFLRETSKK